MLSKFFQQVYASFFKEEVSQQVPDVRTYRITVIRYTPEPASQTASFISGQAAVCWLGIPTDTDCFIEASVTQGRYSLGEFYVWCSGTHAHARICEHRGHYASPLDSALSTHEIIKFRDDDGTFYTPETEYIVPRDLAIEAIRSWLIDLERPGVLRWS